MAVARPQAEGRAGRDRRSPAATAQQTSTAATAAVDLDDGDRGDFPGWHIFGACERAGSNYLNWQGFVSDVAITEFQRTAFCRGMEAAIDPIDERLTHEATGAACEAAGQLSNAATSMWTEAIHFGAVLGYALARTMPAGLDGFDHWLERAKRLAAYRDRDPSGLFGYPKMPAEWATPPPTAGGASTRLEQARAGEASS